MTLQAEMPLKNRMRFVLFLFLLCTCVTAHGSGTQATLQAIAAAEVARGDAQAMQPPTEGWQKVAVPDFIDERWHAFSGVAWYRMGWDQADAAQPAAIVFEYLSMAGAIYVNGTLIERDADLVAPISRSWKTPRLVIVEAPLLKAGRNELLVRVSAVAEFGPGIGPVSVGTVAAAHARYENYRFWRQDLFRFTLLIEATLGAFFLMLWLLRRSETAFGWYGASQLLWFGYIANYIATDVWPFANHYDWAVASAICLALFVGTFTMFVLRFCARRWPRFETAVWIAIGIGVALQLALPMPLNDAFRIQFVVISGLFGTAVNVMLIVIAWRGRAIEPRILSAIAVLHIAGAVHDMLAFTRVIETNVYYADNTAFLNTIGIAALLIWRYARSLQRIQSFNVQLQDEVAVARSELAATLQREHETEMTHARIGERLSFARDLHDGFGSSLMGGLSALEHAPESLPAPQLVKLLRDLRDELRLIVDTSVHDAQADGSFAEQLVPLRHRLTRLLEAKDIASRWSFEDLDGIKLGSTRTLDVLRFLQEALTNVIKHSGAAAVNVSVRRAGEAFDVDVVDDGTGIGAAPGDGAGMASMRARARRLAGEFELDSAPGRTRVALRGVPLAAR
jgi:signal transduction histidine kinase